jgi:flagellar biosynthesis/type III secretory pathway M-ring protein FliF/YscJ
MEDDPITLNRHESRQTIIANKLNYLWENNKIVYVIILVAIFALAMLVITLMVQTIVLPSRRYTYLDSKETERVKKILGIRHSKRPIEIINGKIVFI